MRKPRRPRLVRLRTLPAGAALKAGGTLRYVIKGTPPEADPTYFVKNGGNDGAAGTSDATAWATVDKVNWTTLTAGQSVGFKRGDTWREKLVPRWNSAGAADNHIVFRAYGTGEKPLLLGGLDLSASGGWADQGSNKWRWTTTNALDTSMLFFNGATSCAVRKASLAALASQGDFFYDTATDYTYLYSASNPGTYYSHIESSLAQAFCHCGSEEYITVSGLDIRYWGAGALTSYPGSGHTYEYNDVSYIGGNTIGFPAGNGIGGQGTNGDIIRYNHIHQVYDAGLSTINTAVDNQLTGDEFYGNVVSNCEYGYEQQSYDTGDYQGINVHDNVFYKCGDTLWHAQRSDPSGYGLQSWSHTGVTPTSCHFDDNIVYGSHNVHVRIPGTGWTADGNRYYADGPKFYIYASDANNFAAWQAHGYDAAGSLIDETAGDDATVLAALEAML